MAPIAPIIHGITYSQKRTGLSNDNQMWISFQIPFCAKLEHVPSYGGDLYAEGLVVLRIH